MKFLLRILVLTLMLFPMHLFGQQGVITGRVYENINNQPIPFANVIIEGTTIGTTTDENGKYEINGLTPDLYNLQVSFLGYETKTIYEIQVSNARTAIVDVGLDESATQLQEVEVVAAPFEKSAESPLSVKSIGTNEIQRYPGGNRDISRVIQSLPGVSSSVSFRNDIIIRGGAPNENRFYLDGIEVPVINHFSTQGASGGPVGMINVDFIKSVDFYAGAFPASRGNTLSSILAFDLIEGRTDRVAANFTIGASDVGVSVQGPLSKRKRSSFIFSARRSYLQFLFKLIGLPFLPTYNDFQFKNSIKVNENSDLTILGLAAIDNFDLNLERDETEDQRFLLGTLPENSQWNYTIGARYRYFLENGYLIFVVSRNHLNNKAFKYLNNDESNAEGLLLDYQSQEMENKLRFEHTTRRKGFKINYGIAYEYVTYTNTTFTRVTVDTGLVEINYDTDISFSKYGFFGQVSRSFLNNRLSLSFGIRGDGNSYSDDMANPLEQLSPRFSLSIAVSDRLKLNANTGLYYQLPPYTSLGFKDSEGILVNKQNDITYIRAVHYVAGVEYITSKNSQVSVEGFYKGYDNYPFLIRDSISLANLGGDFGVIGDEPVKSVSDGRSYGVEVFFQQKLYKGFFGIVSYTYYRTQFKDKNGVYVPSSWDNQHLVSITMGKKFKKNWEIGVRQRILGGAPYTPFDIEASSLVTNWNQNNEGLPDYDRLNTERLKVAHQLDFRVDKKWFFNKWTLDLYLDIQNAYNFEYQLQQNLTVERDENDEPIILNPNAPEEEQRYKTKFIDNPAGNIIPSIGVIVEI